MLDRTILGGIVGVFGVGFCIVWFVLVAGLEYGSEIMYV